MTSFVLEQNKDISLKHTFRNCINYAMFLKKPLELWMFVPCDLIRGKVVVLNEEDKNYQQAKERCLFEGFEYKDKDKAIFVWDGFNHRLIYTKKTGFHISIIEDLIEFDLQLSQTAIKKLGL
jgi:hypothetical protein